MNTLLSLPRLAACALSLLALATTPSAAQTYPTKPIRLVVPFPAGGGTDGGAGTRPGAGTGTGTADRHRQQGRRRHAIGNDAVAKSPADGHTLLLNTSAIAILPSLNAKLPYTTDTAFAPVTLVGRAPNVAVVRADSPCARARIWWPRRAPSRAG